MVFSSALNATTSHARLMSPEDIADSVSATTKPTSSESQSQSSNAKIVQNYGKLPLLFIQNNGQINESVKFYEKGKGHATYFTNEGIYVNLQTPQASTLTGQNKIADGLTTDVKPKTLNSKLIKLAFLEANKNPEINPGGLQQGKINYYRGNDPKQWKTDIPTYEAVVYLEIYPGIDIKFYGNNRQMEYDLILKPGADLYQVKLAYEGIEKLEIAESGDLEILLKEGKLTQKKPIIYQQIDGKRVTVVGNFKLLESSSKTNNTQFAYTFEVASYDKTHPLIIDPTLVYATYLGGSGSDIGSSIAVDTAGNAYVTGTTESSDFPVSSGAFDTTYNPGCNNNGNCSDIFVVKLNPTGTSLEYATYIGGSSSDFAAGIEVDTSGNIYVAGDTRSIDFPVTSGAYDTTYNTNDDVFMLKLDATGSLTYATYIGGSSADYAIDMAVDGDGNVYATGATTSSDFPVTSGAYDTTIVNGGQDAFVVKQQF